MKFEQTKMNKDVSKILRGLFFLGHSMHAAIFEILLEFFMNNDTVFIASSIRKQIIVKITSIV